MVKQVLLSSPPPACPPVRGRGALGAVPGRAADGASLRLGLGSFAFPAHSRGAAEGSTLQVAREEQLVKSIVPRLLFRCFNIYKGKKFPSLPTFPSVSFILFHYKKWVVKE